MSARHLARLRAKEAEVEEEEEALVQEESSEEEAAPQGNTFLAFGESDTEDSDSDEDVKKEEEEDEGEEVEVELVARGRKPRKGKAAPVPVVDTDALLAAAMAAAAAEAPVDGLDTWLQVDARWVNYAVEWRKLFGKDAVVGDLAAKRDAAKGGRRGRGQRGGPKAATRNRKWMLWTPDPDLPQPPSRVSGGMSMRLLSSDDRVRYFGYEWSEEYMVAQEAFAAASSTYDPQSFNVLLHRQPFHVDTLLQLSEYYRATRQVEASTHLLHRALHVLEAAFHPSFKPWEYPCRVDPTPIPNKVLFTVLFRHVQTTGKSGCHRAAFEVSKLLLQCAPVEDPMRALFCVDFYGLQARQFVRVARIATASAGLRIPGFLLPNLAYSTALALFHCERGDAGDEGLAPPDGDTATTALLKALLMYPQCLIPLVEFCGLNASTTGTGTVGPPGVPTVPASHCTWGTVLTHPLFSGVDFDSDDLERMASVFVTRHLSLWKQSAALVWLWGTATLATRAFDAWSVAPPATELTFHLPAMLPIPVTAVMSPLPDGLDAAWPSAETAAGTVLALASLRAAVYAPTSDGITRGVVLPEWLIGTDGPPRRVGDVRDAMKHYFGVVVSDFSDDVTTMAAEDLGEWQAGDLAAAGAGFDAPNIVGPVGELNPDQGLLALFLNSMLPWNVAGGGGGE